MATGYAGDVVEGSAPIHFRTNKKRKTYRRRADGGEGDTEVRPLSSNGPPVDVVPPKVGGEAEEMDEDEDAEDGDTPSLAVLRARNSRKGRLQGVGFKSGGSGGGKSTGGDLVGPLVLSNRDHGEDEEDSNRLLSITSRFTHQTGLLNDVDHRHMYELSPLRSTFVYLVKKRELIH